MNLTDSTDSERHQKANTRRARRALTASRRWCIPPAVMREENESLEFTSMLGEHPGDQACLLWQALRDVTLLASVEPERREGLFKPEAADARRAEINGSKLEVRVALNLTALTAVIASPAEVSTETVMMMCMDLAKWAENRVALATAVAFAQAAALIEPEAPRPAARVGHLALRWGRHTRAETWLRRAVGLARRAKDWESYGSAYVALSNILADRKQPTAARAYAIQAMRVGRRHGLQHIRGTALHALCRLAMAAGDYKAAKHYARPALRALGRGHSELPNVMLDIAYLMVLGAEYDRAVPYLRKLMVGVADPVRRARILALLARAAAGVASTAGANKPAEAAAKETYRQAWSDAWMLLTAPRAKRDEASAATLLELARAAAMLRDNPRLEQAARLDREVGPARRTRTATAESDALQELVKETLQVQSNDRR